MPSARRPKSSRSTRPLLATLAACPTRSSSRRRGSLRGRPFPGGTTACSRGAGRRCGTSSSGASVRRGARGPRRADGSARAFGRDGEAVGHAHMLTGDIGETALRARHDTLAEPTLAHFLPIGMMLATPVLDLAEIGQRFPPPYVVEDKYDGVRAQVHKAGDRVELYSRTFDRVTDRFPELLEPLRAIEGGFVLGAAVPATKSA